MCRKKPKSRQFFLFNDILVYGNIIINKKKYNKQHIIPLEEVKLESLEDDNRKLDFTISFHLCVMNIAIFPNLNYVRNGANVGLILDTYYCNLQQ